jgi:type IV pilus assembly protein PilB
MANLNISEKRLPQDGRINVNALGKQIPICVRTLPTAFGESIVLRVLDRASVNLDVEALGFPEIRLRFRRRSHPAPERHFRRDRPDSVAAKPPTLYSCLRRVNTIDFQIAHGGRSRRI